MKNSIYILLILFVFAACGNNERSKLPSTGNFGKVVKTDSLKTVNDVIAILENKTEASVNVTGTIEKVCKGEGCWLTLENKSGKALFIEVENKAFVLPNEIEGKQATISGMAIKDSVSNKIKVLANAINIQ